VRATPLLRLVAAAALVLSGCSIAASDTVAGSDHLVIGVKADQPGLGARAADGTFRGFEVEVGRYIARSMGAAKVDFVAVTSRNRERMLADHTVDLVLASYSITPDRARQVTFGGPYYLAHQDIMVRADERAIRRVRDLAGRTMCQASGSVSSQRVTEGLGVAARLVPSPSYSDCVRRLLGGGLDAVSTGDLVLAGFARESGARVRIVNAPFTDEPYGVGLRKGDIDGCEAVNRAITHLFQDGTATRLLHRWFADTGLKINSSVPEFEGCD
jgi:ABC-type amino acid transport substrate-binding protein